MKTVHIFLCLVLTGTLLLTGCSGKDNAPKKTLNLTSLPGLPVDPSDLVMRQSIQSTLGELQAPAFSTYEHRRIDLDNDGRRDALVLFKTPYGFWCGKHGCAMLVMKASDTDFKLVNVIQPIRPPLYIGENETYGWKTLVARVSGRWDEAKDVEIAYNGMQYPSNPANLEPAAGTETHSSRRLFAD